jgi:hypothetical protein
LRPIAWRTQDAKRRMTEPPEEDWAPGEIAYQGGRVIAVLDSANLDGYIELRWSSDSAEVAENATPVTRACRQLAASAGGRRAHAVWLDR